jgi:hypothetical protein
MELSEHDRSADEIQPTSDIIKAKQNVRDALRAMAVLIGAKQSFPEPKMPRLEDPLQSTESTKYNILTEVESILKEGLDSKINRLDKALLNQYMEARQNQDWKQAHDLLRHSTVKHPYSWENDYLVKAWEWTVEAEDLLDFS